MAEEKPLEDLKSWRKKIGLSQQKLADLAKVSLQTLRQLELGKHRPQRRTLTKVMNAIKRIEEPEFRAKLVATRPKPGRKPGRKAVAAKDAAPKRRGRPPKAAAPDAAPKRRGRPPKAAAAAAAPAAAPKRRGRPPKAAAAPKASGTGPIQLSNLDLELITRILNMTNREKLTLLERIV